MNMVLKSSLLTLLLFSLTSCNGKNLFLDEVDPRPTVTITSNVESITSSQSIPITITFNKAVSGLDSSEILITGGTILDFSGSGSVYNCVIVSNASAVSVQILSGVAISEEGHLNRASEIKSFLYPTTVSNENSAACFDPDLHIANNLSLGL